MTDPTTTPTSKELLQKLIFGAVDDFQKQPINTKCSCQILPQPRKATNCSKSSFSGLWTAFQKQPMTDPTTAPKSNELLRSFIVLKPVLNDLVSRSKQKSAVKMAHRSHKNYKMAREPLKTQGMTDSAWYRQL